MSVVIKLHGKKSKNISRKSEKERKQSSRRERTRKAALKRFHKMREAQNHFGETDPSI